MFHLPSAGAGRTGTLIAIDYLLEEGKDKDTVDVRSCVTNLREQKISMVQSVVGILFPVSLTGWNNKSLQNVHSCYIKKLYLAISVSHSYIDPLHVHAMPSPKFRAYTCK